MTKSDKSRVRKRVHHGLTRMNIPSHKDGNKLGLRKRVQLLKQREGVRS